MAYTINLTDGTVFATIPDGTVNTSSSMILVGKNYAGYGEFLDENFIHLLESGSNTTAPASPLTGQLWWDKTNNLLKVYNGTTWKTVSAATASSTTPTSNVSGDLWFDTTNVQLKVYNGATSSFVTVGPAYTNSQGVTGAVPETINDSTATPHFVTTLYVNDTRVAIVSKDANFTAAAPVSTLFPTIYRGITLSNDGVGGTNFAGNVVNGGNVTITAAGTTTATITSTGANITGYATITGNVTGGNLITAGLATVTGNVTGGNLRTAGLISATGNVNGGNLISAGLVQGVTVSATGNVVGGNVTTAGIVSATGNITGGNVATTLVSATTVSAIGNVQAGNLRTTGQVSATGNITSAGNISGTFILGDGSQLSNISAAVSVTQIQNGTSNARINATNGNLAISVGGVANVIVVDTSTMYANVVSVQSIAKTGTNAVGNIGSSSNYFNQVFATATTALYADVAERFEADEVMEPGTVVELGGVKEITKSRSDLSEKVFGVISTKPAYTMNGGAGSNETHPPVAMTGRVPVKVTGIIKKGDRLVSAGDGLARAALVSEITAFNVIGRSLVDKPTPGEGTIEAIVTIK